MEDVTCSHSCSSVVAMEAGGWSQEESQVAGSMLFRLFESSLFWRVFQPSLSLTQKDEVTLDSFRITFLA